MIIRRLASFLSLTIVVLLPFYYFRFDLIGLPTNLVEVLIVLLLVFTLLSYRRLSVPGFWPIGLIIIGVVTSGFFALDQKIAYGIVKGWFIVPLIYYICLNTIFPPHQRQVFIRPLLINLLLVSIYAIGQYFGLIPLLNHQIPEARQYLDQERAVGFFESPNFLAMYLVPLTLLTGGYFVLTRNYRICWWLVLPLVAIVLSQSQAGLMAVGAGIVWLWLWKPAGLSVPSRRKLIVAALGVTAVLAALWRWADDQARLLIWENAWVMIKEHPIFGIGPGQFRANFIPLDNYGGQFALVMPYALHPHNLLLNFYLSTGLMGLAGYIWLLFRLGRGFFRNTVKSPLAIAALAGLIAVLAHGLFDSTYFKNDLAIIFWVLVFLVSNGYKEVNENTP